MAYQWAVFRCALEFTCAVLGVDGEAFTADTWGTSRGSVVVGGGGRACLEGRYGGGYEFVVQVYMVTAPVTCLS